MSQRRWLRRRAVSFGNSSRLNFEKLEDRLLLANFTVNSDHDVSDGLCDDTHCTLREAIEAANALVGADIVHFEIAGAEVPTIAPQGELPTVTDPLTIDGTTQLAGRVELDGSNAGSGSDGLVITAGDSTVRGLVINRFSGRGIVLARNGGNRVEASRIGSDATGTVDRGNRLHGVLILDTANNTIGGASVEAGNVISGNDAEGVQIYGSGASELAALDPETLEQAGQIIDPDGDCQFVLDQTDVTITIPATAHDLSAELNIVNAPRVLQPVSGDLIAEVTVSGTFRPAGDSTLPGRLPFNGAGILLWQDERNYARLERTAYVRDGELIHAALLSLRENGEFTVERPLLLPDETTFLRLTRRGGFLFALANQGDARWVPFDPIPVAFSEMLEVGVDAINTATQPFMGELNDFRLLHLAGETAVNVVAGNMIGTDITGTMDLGNSFSGVSIRGSDGNTIGSSTPESRNIISGNDNHGIYIAENSIGNIVSGNFIGIDATGAAALGNVTGVLIHGASGNTIGGVLAGARNVISANTDRGVQISGNGATANAIQGNFIGTDATGMTRMGNYAVGVIIDGASNNTIGGAADGSRNIISGGNLIGINIFGASATGNLVQGNYIGVDAVGSSALGNMFAGILLHLAPRNTIGGTAAGSGNLISGNGSAGINVNTSANETLIQGNVIGSLTGGNGQQGIVVHSSFNTIGGSSAGARNIISNNSIEGVLLFSAASTNNQILGNWITENGTHGIAAGQFARNNTIGTPCGPGGSSNVIASNQGDGVRLSDEMGAPTGFDISCNTISDNAGLGINLGGGGVAYNDPGDRDAGANNLQNFPVLRSAVIKRGVATIRCTLTSTPRTAFRIEFFANDSLDPSGHGEGRALFDLINVVTNRRGTAKISVRSTYRLQAGQFVTATATDPNGNTSEFSPGQRVVQRGQAVQTAFLERQPADSGSSLETGVALPNAKRRSTTILHGILQMKRSVRSPD